MSGRGKESSSFKVTPNWFKHFPIESDRQALKLLAKSSDGPLEKPREMNFCLLNIPVHGSECHEIIHRLSEAEWNSTEENLPNAPGKLMLTVTKPDYVVAEHAHNRDVLFFRRLAELYGIIYDGWFASN